MDQAELDKRFTYHAPQGDQAARYQVIRDAYRALAVCLSNHCPESRELSVAFTHLETANFWSNASIARRE